MIDFDKLDRMDIEVVDEPWKPEERKAFSEFLKSRKKTSTIPDYKKLDEIDVLICSNSTPEEDKLTSKFLKAYKAKLAREKKPRLTPASRKTLTAKAKH
jgi:hypothetical protein